MSFEFLQPTHRRVSRWFALFGHFGSLGLLLLAIVDSSPLPTFGGADILLIILVSTRPLPWYEFATAATIGSVVGAYITFRMARRVGREYLYKKFGASKVPKLLNIFEKWGTAALVASTAIPVPQPTSVFFAGAGASDRYSSGKFLTIVGFCRAARYSAIAFIAHVYGRHVIRILRHPTQYWKWLLLGMAVAALVMSVVMAINKRLPTATNSSNRAFKLGDA